MSTVDLGAQGTSPERSPVNPIHIVADPAPLGLAAFAMTTLALSLSGANIWPSGITAALGLALVYGGFAQLLAGMWEFARKNTFGAIAFTSYGAFWISYYVLGHFLLGSLSPAAADQAVGVFLLGWTILTFYLMIASLRVNGAVLSVFVALDITFVLLTIGAFEANTHVNKVGGWTGIVTAALAFYASAAGVINETFKKPILPVFPLAPRS
jgi:succinate-acetate transporter protein